MLTILLVRAPRLYWPFINEYDNFLLPQSLVCLSAVLRENGFNVIPLDCMPSKIGWQSLGKLIIEKKADIVGVGDSESLYASEAVKVLEIAKEVNPKIITVAGGAHFSHLIEESFAKYPIDFIVRGEGEYTLLELAREIEKKGQGTAECGVRSAECRDRTPCLSEFSSSSSSSGLNVGARCNVPLLKNSSNSKNAGNSILDGEFEKVQGIAYKQNEKIIITQPRPLINNLDELPIPAYDLMPMSQYGKAKFLFSPGGITIHHSRGCTDNCKFCVWWVQMAEEKKADNGKIYLTPRWRTKTVGKTISEIDLLYSKYKKRCLIFVDDSWNIDKNWNEAFAESLARKNWDVHWFAFMRADHIIRDHQNGIFKKLVKAGLFHICIGVERQEDAGFKSFGKEFYSDNTTTQCFKILKEHYPQVFRQATFIVGVRTETKESLLGQLKYAMKLDADYPAFHPLTPIPGTAFWEEAKEKNWLELDDYSYFDWSTPVMSSEFLSREEIEELMIFINKKYVRLGWLLRGLFTPYKYKRNMYIWWLLVIMKVFIDNIKRKINPFKAESYMELIKPKWYDK